MKKDTRIIIPTGMKPRPQQHEIEVAEILAGYFKSDVEFVPRSNHVTPDFLVNSLLWELKSPKGSGRNNIQRQLKEAHRQSENIIVSALRSKLHINKIKGELQLQFKRTRSIKRLLLINKAGGVLEITR